MHRAPHASLTKQSANSARKSAEIIIPKYIRSWLHYHHNKMRSHGVCKISHRDNLMANLTESLIVTCTQPHGSVPYQWLEY